MEILVYLDEHDKKIWSEVVGIGKKFHWLTIDVNKKDASEDTKLAWMEINIAYKNKTSDFWHYMVSKYGVLKNKPISIDQTGTFVFVRHS